MKFREVIKEMAVGPNDMPKRKLIKDQLSKKDLDTLEKVVDKNLKKEINNSPDGKSYYVVIDGEAGGLFPILSKEARIVNKILDYTDPTENINAKENRNIIKNFFKQRYEKGAGWKKATVHYLNTNDSEYDLDAMPVITIDFDR